MRHPRVWGAMLVVLTMLAAIPATAATTPGAGAVTVALEFDGVRVTGLTQVGAVEATLADQSSACMEAGICTEEVSQALDDLDRTAAGVTDRARHDIAMNAIRNMKALMGNLSDGIGDLDGDGYPDLARKTYQPGQPVYGNITFERSGLNDRLLYEWYQKAARGEDARKSGSIIYLDRSGKEVARYDFFECWPTAWRVRTEGGIVEEIELAVEKVERARSSITVNEEGVPKTSFAVLLQADGADVGRFESVSPLIASLTWGDEDCDDTDAMACPKGGRPVRCSDGSCVAGLKTELDRLEQAITEAAPANRDELLKLIAAIRAQISPLDAALEGAYRPGRIRYGRMTLERTLGQGEAAAGWINDTAQGKPWKRTATLLFLGPDGKPLAEIDLGATGPVRYAVENRGGQLVETLEVRVDRIEMK